MDLFSDQFFPELSNIRPTQITEVATFNALGSAYEVELAGSLAYVAYGGTRGLRVLDVSDPFNIREIGTFVGSANDVELVGNFAYVLGSDGLQVLDVSNPTAIREVGAFDTGGIITYDLAVVGSLAYVPNKSSGLLVLDVSDPAAIREVGAFDTPGDAFGVMVIGNLA